MATKETPLRTKLDDVGDVLTSGDADRIGDLYTEDAKLMPPGSDFVTGRDAVVEFWQSLGDAGIETIDVETVEVERHGNAASRVGTATLADGNGGTVDEVKFVELWRSDDGTWRIHSDIWNSVLPDGN